MIRSFSTQQVSSRGYTLLELIVSVGLFSLVILAVTSAFLSLISLDTQSRGTTDLVTNLSFVIDSMEREIRLGTAYQCNDNAGIPNCGASVTATPGTSFGFSDSRSPSRHIVYSISNNQLIESVTTGGTTVSYPLTDPRVKVTVLSFYVRGVGRSSSPENVQEPQVTFVIRGTLVLDANKSLDFALQGSATERLLEIPT